jgi:hypothetical protein
MGCLSSMGVLKVCPFSFWVCFCELRLLLHLGNHLVDFFRYFFLYISNSYSGFSSYKVHIFVFVFL